MDEIYKLLKYIHKHEWNLLNMDEKRFFPKYSVFTFVNMDKTYQIEMTNIYSSK